MKMYIAPEREKGKVGLSQRMGSQQERSERCPGLNVDHNDG